MDFVENDKESEIETWISGACDLMEKLNIKCELGDELSGADLEPQVGSEPAVENLRGLVGNVGVVLSTSREDTARYESEDSDIPDLTPATTSDTEEDQADIHHWNFKGGIRGSRILDYTDDRSFDVDHNKPVDREEFVLIPVSEIVRNSGGLCGSQGDNVGRNIGNGDLDLSTEFGQNDLLIVRIRWMVSGYREMLRTVVGYVAIKVKMLEEIWQE